jgi:glycosyltransferase involved in cell wall biosynthesis
MSRFLFSESSNNLGGQELQILLQMATLLSAGHHAVLACRRGSGIAREAAARGMQSRDSVFRLPGIPALRGLLLDERIEAAFCHSGHDALYVALAARLVRKRPLLIRVRTYQPGVPKAFGYNVLADRTLVHSEHMRRRLLANPAIRPGRIALLRPILPLAEIRAQAKLPLPEGLAGVLQGRKPVIVHAAMLRPEKGHRTLLDAIAGLRGRYPGLVYVIAGAGPEEAALRERARELGLGQAVHFAGLVMPVYPLLARADLVIMPSLDEPLGLAQVEALALGVPVAVSDAGGLPETVEHGRTGWVLPAGDVEAWEEGLAEALADPARARAMAERGRRYVEATFAPERFLAALQPQLEHARRSRDV